MQGDLTTLPRVKAWLGLADSTGSDTILARLIGAASRFVYGYLDRESFDVTLYDEIYDGGGQGFMLLAAAPVVGIDVLTVSGRDLPAYSNSGAGYRVEPNDLWGNRRRLSLVNAIFDRGVENVRVEYRAGFRRTETHTLPAPEGAATTIPVPVEFAWLSDLGVEHGEEILVPGDDYTVEAGVYAFPAARAGETVSISYGYAPADVEQAVIELVGERFKVRDRIGQNSVSLGNQQTISFSTKDMSEFCKTLLNGFRRSAPL